MEHKKKSLGTWRMEVINGISWFTIRFQGNNDDGDDEVGKVMRIRMMMVMLMVIMMRMMRIRIMMMAVVMMIFVTYE